MEFDHKVSAFDDEGLVAADKEKKDWKGIVISLLVIGNIMGAIIVAIILCTPDGDLDTNKAKLEFDLLLSDQFKMQTFNGTWLSDHEIVYVDQNGSIVIFDAETNKSSSMLVKTYDKTLHTMAGFRLSADRQSILFVSDVRYEFGTLISARYAIFNISSQTVEFLDDLVKSRTSPLREPRIQYANWGPSSNSIVFIESNDIYLIRDFSSTTTPANEDESRVSASLDNLRSSVHLLRLTSSGGDSTSSLVRNGLPDSLYRTSIFSQASEPALWWSPDGYQLAYLSFNDSLVEPSPVEFYDSQMEATNLSAAASRSPVTEAIGGGVGGGEGGNQYELESGPSSYSPRVHYERYPRAGGVNPRVSLRVVDLRAAVGEPESGDESKSLESASANIWPPADFLRQQQADSRLAPYITYVGWLPQRPEQQAQLLVMWSNRAQSTAILNSCTSKQSGWSCATLATFSQRMPPSANARRTILSAVDSNGTRLIFFALPRPDSIIGDHYHVALLRGEERAPKYLTHGEYDIDRLLGYEPATDSLFFEAKIAERAERHLYRVSPIGNIAARQINCLTCNLEEPCGYSNVHIAPRARYFVHECLGPSVPRTYLRHLVGAEEAAPIERSQPRLQVRPLTGLEQVNGTGRSPAQKSNSLKSIALLGSYPNIEHLMRTKQMPVEKFIVIKSDQQQIPCDVYMKLYLPSEIEEEKDKRFPLLIESSEIDQRNVWRRFDLDWGKYLASKKQIVYAKMDCIRTRANRQRRSTRLVAPLSASATSLAAPIGVHPGVSSSSSSSALFADDSPLFNAKDQVEAIKFLAENSDLFPYIDRRRIAIWGPNSNSAYVALATTINDDSKLIQCTIAISPITNWRYMSSHAAEHYLGLPWLDANSLKYEQANLLRRTSEFALRKLLIVHGTADEQVHVQHSMQFIKSLTDHHITGGSLHQMQLYPDVGHSLEQVKRHLYLTLDGFVDRCFYQKPIAIKATEWKGKMRPKLY